MKDTPTPRTDEAWAAWPYAGSGISVHVGRELERELTAVTEQRDRLAEALHHLTTHGDYHQPMLRDTVSNIANKALQSLNQDHFPDVGNMIGTTTTKP